MNQIVPNLTQIGFVFACQITSSTKSWGQMYEWWQQTKIIHLSFHTYYKEHMLRWGTSNQRLHVIAKEMSVTRQSRESKNKLKSKHLLCLCYRCSGSK